jgi:cell division protease FtsH
MITAFGMSEKLGRVRYQANEQEVFLGHAVTQTQNVSEATAQLIDQDVRRLIEEAEGKARQILTDHLEDLHLIAKALLEYETLSKDEIGQVLRGEKIVRDDTGGAGSGPDRRRRASVPTSSTGQAPGGANPEPQPGV